MTDGGKTTDFAARKSFSFWREDDEKKFN